MKIILGIQEAHDASAALMIDGEIVAAAQEERFTGLKGDYGYPEKAIAAILRQTGTKTNDIDEVVLASHKWNPVLTKIKRNANFSVDDWVEEQHKYWKPKLFEHREANYYELYRNRQGFQYDQTYPMDHLLTGYMDPDEMAEMARIRRRIVSEKLEIAQEKVRTVTHEDCHRFYAYFGSPLRGKVLSLTSEGVGDYSNGTVTIFDAAEQEELSSTLENHLGHIYQYITLILGMKPAQHEYKVMGLAPYANVKEVEKSYRVFKDILKVENLDIVYDKKPEDLYFWFRDKLEGHRFDGIAGGLQLFLENRLVEWTRACYENTNLGRIVFSGGVAQNIKACKRIAELDSIDEIYVVPAAGDTSLPLGACYRVMWEHQQNNGRMFKAIKPLDNIYLGPEYANDEIEEVLRELKVEQKYGVEKGVTAEYVAKLLTEGMVIARCCGRMEFGLRALGNRSIMADPRKWSVVRKINSQIKFRDFWMPFTPTILSEREEDYVVNPKRLSSPFMTMAFDSTKKAQDELIAALHPADFTVRPQILEKRRNPDYYRIIKEFERMTGVGGILNTSFNLHGMPIVLGPGEAMTTMDNSELDGLLLGDFLITRR